MFMLVKYERVLEKIAGNFICVCEGGGGVVGVGGYRMDLPN